MWNKKFIAGATVFLTIFTTLLVLWSVGALNPRYEEIYNIEFLERKTESFSISEMDGVYYIGIEREGQTSKLLEGSSLVSVIAQARAELK